MTNSNGRCLQMDVDKNLTNSVLYDLKILINMEIVSSILIVIVFLLG